MVSLVIGRVILGPASSSRSSNTRASRIPDDWRRALALLWAVLSWSAVACGRRGETTTHPGATTGPTWTTSASPTARAITPPSPARRGVPCGPLGCTQYDSPADAFLEAIVAGPLVLAIGETHAPRGATAPSAARRFTEELLPLLAGRASDLLVELMMPPGGCLDASAEVRAEQRVVTSRQAETNQSEYLQMGESARSLGIVPDMLRPTCGDLAILRGDHGDAVDAALETIARLTAAQAKRLVARDEQSDADAGKLVVVYGGALHNDLAPRPDKARWSYAPELDEYTHGRVVAVDLVVPEFIGDDETWRALPWRAAYDVQRLGDRTTLFQTGDRSFVLVFARAR